MVGNSVIIINADGIFWGLFKNMQPLGHKCEYDLYSQVFFKA